MATIVADQGKHIRAIFGPEISKRTEDEVVDVFGSKLDSNSLLSEPPPLDSLDLSGRLNESGASSSKSVHSVRLPKSALREISDPRALIEQIEKEQCKGFVDSRFRSPENGVMDFVNNNAVVINPVAAEFENRNLGDQNSPVEVVSGNTSKGCLRSEAKSALQKSTTVPKKFIPACIVMPSETPKGETKSVSNEEQAQLTAAAVSAAMSAAIPYFKGQTDLEGQMRLLLDKVTRLEMQEPKIIEPIFERDSSTTRIERQLAELTEKRLQLLERVLERESKVAVNPNYYPESDPSTAPSTSRSFHPVNIVENDSSQLKSAQYTKVATAPRNALLSKASSNRKKTRKCNVSKTSFNDTSLFPRDAPPRPIDPSNELLKEILQGHNDSSLHTLDNSALSGRNFGAPQIPRGATTYEAEARILKELALLKEELMTLKVREPSNCGDDKTPRSLAMMGNPDYDLLETSRSSLTEEQLNILRKRKSELLSQYFQEYSNPSPFRVERHKLADISNASLEQSREPEQVLNEMKSFRKRYELERQIQLRDLNQGRVHNRIDQICDGLSTGYYQLRRNVDREISKIQAEIDRELEAAEMRNKEALENEKQAALKSKGKPIKGVANVRDRRIYEKPGQLSQSKKPTASVKPNNAKSQMASRVHAKLTGESKQASQVQEISPTQLAYQQLILQRQAEYREKIDKLQNLPAGSTVQNAGLLYNRNFYPVKGQVLTAAPEMKEVSTETKFQQNQEIQTETQVKEKLVPPVIPGKRVDLQNVVSENRKDRLVIESLPCVEIESKLDKITDKENIPKDEDKTEIPEPVRVHERANISDVIIVPGYRVDLDSQRPSGSRTVNFGTTSKTYAQLQSCIEDEIMSHILRNVIGDSSVPTDPRTPEEDQSEVSSLSPEDEYMLQIFIDAGIPMDKYLLRKLGEEEVMKIILGILEEQKRNQLKEKLEPVNVDVNRVPTPTGTVDDYTPDETEEVSEQESEPKAELVSRGMSPISFGPAEESFTEDVTTEYSTRVSRPVSREQTSPKLLVDTPERTPPSSPENSVVESSLSVAKEAPPSPEKVAPSKMPEPAKLSTVFDDIDMIDAGIQYEAPPSFRDTQTSPIQFAPVRPQNADYSPHLETTESSGESSTEVESSSNSGTSTVDAMSDHEWVVPHNMLKSEGEITPPKMPKG